MQLLRGDEGGAVEAFLREEAARARLFAHLLLCALRTEGTPPAEAFAPAVKRSGWKPPEDSGIWAAADAVADTARGARACGAMQRVGRRVASGVHQAAVAAAVFFLGITPHACDVVGSGGPGQTAVAVTGSARATGAPHLCTAARPTVARHTVDGARVYSGSAWLETAARGERGARRQVWAELAPADVEFLRSAAGSSWLETR